MSEAEAREAGYEVRVAKTPTAAVPRAKTLGRTEGFFKVIIDARTDLILGAAIIGAEASEVVTSIQMAMLGRPDVAAGARRRHHPPHHERGTQHRPGLPGLRA